MGFLEKMLLGAGLMSTNVEGPSAVELGDELVEVQEKLREKVAAKCPKPLESLILEDERQIDVSNSGWVVTTLIPLENFSTEERGCIGRVVASMQWTSNRDFSARGSAERQVMTNVNLSWGDTVEECTYASEDNEDVHCIVLTNENVNEAQWERIEDELMNILPEGMTMKVRSFDSRNRRLKFYMYGRRVFTIKVLVPKGTEPGVYTRRVEDGEDFVKIKSPDLKRDFYVSPKDAVETELRRAGY